MDFKLPDNYYDDPAARGWLCEGCGANTHYGEDHEPGCEFIDTTDPDTRER